ncbi:MAG TPA: hypothetical protein VF887_04920, partial [Gemmatimonadaceae bacterium]
EKISRIEKQRLARGFALVTGAIDRGSDIGRSAAPHPVRIQTWLESAMKVVGRDDPEEPRARWESRLGGR